MIDILFAGSGMDSNQVIEAVMSAVDADIGYRYESPGYRNGQSAWGVRVFTDDVNESAVVDAIESEFGEQTRVQ